MTRFLLFHLSYLVEVPSKLPVCIQVCPEFVGLIPLAYNPPKGFTVESKESLK